MAVATMEKRGMPPKEEIERALRAHANQEKGLPRTVPVGKPRDFEFRADEDEEEDAAEYAPRPRRESMHQGPQRHYRPEMGQHGSPQRHTHQPNYVQTNRQRMGEMGMSLERAGMYRKDGGGHSEPVKSKHVPAPPQRAQGAIGEFVKKNKWAVAVIAFGGIMLISAMGNMISPAGGISGINGGSMGGAGVVAANSVSGAVSPFIEPPAEMPICAPSDSVIVPSLSQSQPDFVAPIGLFPAGSCSGSSGKFVCVSGSEVFQFASISFDNENFYGFSAVPSC